MEQFYDRALKLDHLKFAIKARWKMPRYACRRSIWADARVGYKMDDTLFKTSNEKVTLGT